MKNVYLLPTDKPSRLVKYKNNLFIENKSIYGEPSIQLEALNIYITSDEEIKEWDWFYDLDTKYVKIKQSWENSHLDFNSKKIILTTDQELIKDGIQAIDEEFLEWFVKNPSCEEVKIESWQTKGEWDLDYKIIIPKEEQKQHLIDIMRGDEELGLYDEQPKQDYIGVHLRHCYQGEYEDGCKYGEDDCPAKPKEEPNKTHYLDELPNMNRDVLAKMWESAIPKLSSKQETIEEAALRLYPKRISDEYNPFEDLLEEERNIFIAGTKWQQERSYSEEEVITLLESLVEHPTKPGYKRRDILKVIEQLKTKQ